MKFNFKDYKKFCREEQIPESNFISLQKFKVAVKTEKELEAINFHLISLENLEKVRASLNG